MVLLFPTFFLANACLSGTGTIKCKEYIIDEFDSAPQALVDVARGYDSVGKPVVVVDPAGLK